MGVEQLKPPYPDQQRHRPSTHEPYWQEAHPFCPGPTQPTPATSAVAQSHSHPLRPSERGRHPTSQMQLPSAGIVRGRCSRSHARTACPRSRAGRSRRRHPGNDRGRGSRWRSGSASTWRQNASDGTGRTSNTRSGQRSHSRSTRPGRKCTCSLPGMGKRTRQGRRFRHTSRQGVCWEDSAQDAGSFEPFACCCGSRTHRMSGTRPA